jgi:sodium-dependent dicarboxylate transporter 2/3/5
VEEQPANPVGPQISEAEARFDRVRRRIGLVLAPSALLILLAVPMPGLSPEAHRMAAVAVMTVIFWVTEAIPLPVAALLGPAVAVMLGVAPADHALAPFANPLIFLFMGGFMLAQGLSHQGLDRRATLWLLSRGFVAGSPARAMIAIAAVGWLFSMWISNTATTAMMVPIAMGLSGTIRRFCPDDEDAKRRMGRYAEGLLITLAYASSMGGTATPIGTAPNLIAIDLLERKAGISIDFLQWMSFGLPISLVAVCGMVALAVRRFPAPIAHVAGLTDHVREQLHALGPMRRGERRVLVVFLLAVAGWVSPALIRLALTDAHPVTQWAKEGLDEGVVALVTAALLFMLPSGERTGGPGEHAPRLITWEHATKIDWGTLFLLGGGFALSNLVFETKLAEAISRGLLGDGGGFVGGAFGLLLLSTALVIYMTELSSNTATINMLLPVIIPLAIGAGFDPLPVTLAVTLAASYAFMLPVSTPPNAIAYGTGAVRIGTMIRFGAWLDVGGLVLLVALGATALRWLPFG